MENGESRRKFSPSKLIGLAGAQLLLILTMMLSGSIGMFIDIPSAVVVFGITFFLLLATFGKVFLRFLADAFLSLFMTPPAPNPEFVRVAEQGSRYAIGAGITGTVVGVISMLSSLDDPSRIGAGLAVALLTSFYAIILAFLVFPYFRSIYSLTMPDEENPKDEYAKSQKPLILGAIGFFILLALLMTILTISLYPM